MGQKVKKINYTAGIKGLIKKMRNEGYTDIHFSCRRKVDGKPMDIPFKDRVLKVDAEGVIRNIGIHRKTHCIGLTKCVAKRKPDKGNYDVITAVITAVSFCSSADEWDKIGGRFWALKRAWRIAMDKDSFRESSLEGYDGYTSQYDVEAVKTKVVPKKFPPLPERRNKDE